MAEKKYLVLSRTFPPDAGGESEYIYNFSKNLRGKVIVLTTSLARYNSKNKNDEVCYKYLKKFSVKRITFFEFFPSLAYLVILFQAILLHAKNRFDLVICSHVQFGYLLLIFKKIFNIDYFLIMHGWEVMSVGIVYPPNKNKAVIENAKKIIVLSNFTKHEIMKRYKNARNIIVIPPMINTEIICESKFNVEFKKSIKLQDRRILLTVGRLSLLEGHKGHHMVLMALPEVLKKHPDVIYLIVGDGKARERLEEFTQELKLSDRVIFHSYDRSLIHNYYNFCDVFIMPSGVIGKTGCVEGFGIVFLEAALFGKPSIGGRTGGINDAIIDGKTGLLVNPTDMSEITNAILKLLDEPEYARKLGENARKRAINEFSNKKISVEIEKLFE